MTQSLNWEVQMWPFFLNSSNYLCMSIVQCQLSASLFQIFHPWPSQNMQNLDSFHYFSFVFYISQKNKRIHKINLCYSAFHVWACWPYRYFYHVVFWPVYISAGHKNVRTSTTCAMCRFLAGLRICVHLHLCIVQVPSRSQNMCTSALVLCAAS